MLRALGALRREGSCGRFAGEGADRLLSSARPTERRVGAGAQRSFMTSRGTERDLALYSVTENGCEFPEPQLVPSTPFT